MSSPKLRDHFFVLAWVALAVIAKYSVSLVPAGSDKAVPAATNIAATAELPAPTFDE